MPADCRCESATEGHTRECRDAEPRPERCPAEVPGIGKPFRCDREKGHNGAHGNQLGWWRNVGTEATHAR